MSSDGEFDDSDGEVSCPLCMEEFDETDKNFKPCPCAYQICRFCWNHITSDLNGLCPACRRPYSDDTMEFKPLSNEELAKIKMQKRRKQRQLKDQEQNQRKQLANVRVVQKNLVYVLGLSPNVASEEVLRQYDFFGQYGKINKIVINRRGNQNAPMTASNNGVYITFARKEDAASAIDAVDGSVCDGRMIRATFGTTKYCSFFLKGQPCQNPGCQYLHEPGEEADSFLKDEKVSRHPTAKNSAFPVLGGGKKEEKEESALPATASWAKPARQISDYIGVSAGSAVATTNSDSVQVLGTGASTPHSFNDEHQQMLPKLDDFPNVSESSGSKKKNFSPSSAPPGLMSVLSNEPVNLGLPVDELIDPPISPINRVNSEISADIHEPAKSLSELGYCLVLKYNGLLDPFENFDLPGRTPSADNFAQQAVPQSRFERMFGDTDQPRPSFQNRSDWSKPSARPPLNLARPAIPPRYLDKMQLQYARPPANEDQLINQLLRTNQIRPSHPVDYHQQSFHDPAIMAAKTRQFDAARPVRDEWCTGVQRPRGNDAAAVFVSATSVKADVGAVETDVGGVFEFDFKSSVVDPTCAPSVPFDTLVRSRNATDYIAKNLSPSDKSASSFEPFPVKTLKAPPPGFEKPLFSSVAKVLSEASEPAIESFHTIPQNKPVTAEHKIVKSVFSDELNLVSNASSKEDVSVLKLGVESENIQVLPLAEIGPNFEISEPALIVEKRSKRKKNRKCKEAEPNTKTPPLSTPSLSAISTPPHTPPLEPLTPPSIEMKSTLDMKDKLTCLSDNLDKLSHSLSCIQKECNNSTLDVYEAKEYLDRAIESLSLTSASVAASEAELLLADNKDFSDPAILVGIKESTKIVMEQIGILEQVALKIGGDRIRAEEGGIDWRKLATDVERREAAFAASLKVAAKAAKRKRKRTSHSADWVKELDKQLFGARLEEKMLEQQFKDILERNINLGIFDLCL